MKTTDQDRLTTMDDKLEQNVEKRPMITVKSLAMTLLILVLGALLLRNYSQGKGIDIPGTGWELPSQFPFFFLIVFSLLSNWLGRKVKFFNLNRGELAIMYVLSGFGLMLMGQGHLMPFIFSLTHGRFNVLLSPDSFRYTDVLPNWAGIAAPQDEDALIGFFLGDADRVPWGEWILPMIIWAVFFASLIFLYSVLAEIFYKRWSEKERLLFALTTPVVAAANVGEGYQDQGYNYKSKLFLLGGIIPIIRWVPEILSNYIPGFPTIPFEIHLGSFFTNTSFSAVDFWPGFYFRVWPYAVGLGYLIPTDISFSVWFFYVLQKIVGVGLSNSGILDLNNAGVAMGFASLHGWGTIFGLAVFVVWIGRKDIAAFFAAAAKEGKNRAMLLVALFCLIYVALIPTVLLGISFWVVVLYLLVLFAFGLAWARIRAESAMPFSVIDMGVGTRFVNFWGVDTVGYANTVSLTVIGEHAMWTLPTTMAWTMEAFKIGDTVNADDNRKLPWLMPLVYIVMVFVALAILLPVFYDVGGFMAPFYSYGNHTWNFLNPLDSGIENAGIYFITGFIFTLAVGFLRMSLLWWPVSSIGYAVSWQASVAYRFPGSFFIAWLVKVLVQRYGGRKLYVKLQPFFVGMVVFGIGMQGLAAIVDILVNLIA